MGQKLEGYNINLINIIYINNQYYINGRHVLLILEYNNNVWLYLYIKLNVIYIYNINITYKYIMYISLFL